jgi:hypothetical protein
VSECFGEASAEATVDTVRTGSTLVLRGRIGDLDPKASISANWHLVQGCNIAAVTLVAFSPLGGNSPF